MTLTTPYTLRYPLANTHHTRHSPIRRFDRQLSIEHSHSPLCPGIHLRATYITFVPATLTGSRMKRGTTPGRSE